MRDGIPSPSGGSVWRVSTLRGIVANEAYLGVVQYKRREHRRGKRTGEVVRVENAHQPLVSRAAWTAAQAASTVQRTGNFVAGIVGKLAVCPSCGGKLSVAGSGKNLTYGCRRQRNAGKCPAPVFITKRIADEVVEAAVRGALVGRVGTSPETRLAELYALEAAAREELERYVEIAAAIDGQAFQKGLAVRQERLDVAAAEREREEARVGLATTLPSVEAFERLHLNDRRRVAAALIREVRIALAAGGRPQDRVTIVWR
jgi:hypothetical protein